MSTSEAWMTEVSEAGYVGTLWNLGILALKLREREGCNPQER